MYFFLICIFIWKVFVHDDACVCRLAKENEAVPVERNPKEDGKRAKKMRLFSTGLYASLGCVCVSAH